MKARKECVGRLRKRVSSYVIKESVSEPRKDEFTLESTSTRKVIKKKNWSDPGPDKIANFSWKKTYKEVPLGCAIWVTQSTNQVLESHYLSQNYLLLCLLDFAQIFDFFFMNRFFDIFDFFSIFLLDRCDFNFLNSIPRDQFRPKTLSLFAYNPSFFHSSYVVDCL